MFRPSFLLAITFGLLNLSEWSYALPKKVKTHNGGAVASESAICSQIGVQLLEAGGSAADAMVGTVICVGVTAMYHSGITGGGFMLVRNSTGGYEMIDFRETAPAKASEDMFVGKPESARFGGLASGVPGELRGLEALHKKYGRLSWKKVLNPSVLLARSGFNITEDMLHYQKEFNASGTFLKDDRCFSEDFAPKGRLLVLGETITRKRYAKALEIIARKGAGAFYEGPIANSMIKALTAANGIMTTEDLKTYKVEHRNPLGIDYRGYKITACEAPASGAVLLSTMKILDQYNDTGLNSEVGLTTHRLDEALRFGFGQRAKLGDPRFVRGMSEYQESMISENTAKRNRDLISDEHTLNVEVYNPEGLETTPAPGTSQISAGDADGLFISLTTTINLPWGSQVCVPEYGMVMNNNMDDFSTPGQTNFFGLTPSRANFIRAGKRPLSSAANVIVEYPNGGGVFMTLGAAGGSKIISAVTEVIWHVLDQKKSLPVAMNMPRFHDQLYPNVMQFEDSYNSTIFNEMIKFGHDAVWGMERTSVQGVMRFQNGTFLGVGEPRQHNSGGFAASRSPWYRRLPGRISSWMARPGEPQEQESRASWCCM